MQRSSRLPPVLAQNKAVLGIPSFLNRPNSSMTPSQTLDGYDYTGVIMMSSSNRPEPRPNFGNQSTYMDQSMTFTSNLILEQQAFNYYRPNVYQIPYIDKLAEEYGVTLGLEQVADQQVLIRNSALLDQRQHSYPSNFPMTTTPQLLGNPQPDLLQIGF